MIKITYKLILLLSLLAMTVTSFAASEAEYGKVSKAWVSIHAPTRGATVCKVTYYKSIN